MSTDNIIEVSGSSYRSDPRVCALKPIIIDYRPFGTVAAIFDEKWVYVGISRCMAGDEFDPRQGEQRATGRVKMIWALCHGLVARERSRRISRRESGKGQLLMRLTPEEFAERFNIASIVAPIESTLKQKDEALALKQKNERLTTRKPRTPARTPAAVKKKVVAKKAASKKKSSVKSKKKA